MPRSSARTLEAIRTAAFELFFQRVYTRVSMDDIAAKVDVTKRTLYYHFDSKDALIADALENRGAMSLSVIQKWRDPDAKTPAEFLDGLVAKLIQWAKSPNWMGSGFTRLVLELADLPGHPVRQSASTHKSAIEEWIAHELEKRGASSPKKDAQAFCILMEGAVVLTFIHNDIRYIEKVREILSGYPLDYI